MNILKIAAVIIMTILALGCATSGYYKLDTVEFDSFDYGFEIKKVKVRNINVAMIDEGKGDQVLLLVHGLGSNAKGWIKNIPELSKKFRVIAVDLPGYGKSDKGYFQFSMKFYAQILTELLTQLNINKATFIGHSMGGQIAITTALEYPARVDKLVLISPAGFERFTEGEGDWMKNAVTADFVKDTPIRNIDINVKSNFFKMPGDAEFMITERIQMRKAKGFDLYCYAVSRNVTAMLDGPVWDKLTDIQQPTLILFGENDGLIPNPYLHGGKTETVAEIGRKEIPNNRLFLFEKCGHFVMFEKAEETNKAIFDFMAEK
ncbi:hypothetical protein B6I21_04500 [candidate division KSB1 bacterium 4572_119]|nr:MAG: hypothetical protein B6I21_04500 [candidate division KSB1 bacterium 4572_119]